MVHKDDNSSNLGNEDIIKSYPIPHHWGRARGLSSSSSPLSWPCYWGMGRGWRSSTGCRWRWWWSSWSPRPAGHRGLAWSFGCGGTLSQIGGVKQGKHKKKFLFSSRSFTNMKKAAFSFTYVHLMNVVGFILRRWKKYLKNTISCDGWFDSPIP